MKGTALLAVCLSVAVASGQDGAWPGFRGPNGSGVAAGTGYPVEFAPGTEAWKAAVPFGQSSPVLVTGKIYLTGSEGDRLITLCLDAKNGEELWRREIHPVRHQKTYPANDPASPTPTADDSGVYVFFADYGLLAYDTDGRERWRMPLGPFRNFYGMAASPILVKETVVQICDQAAESFMVSVDRKSGELKWKTKRERAPIGWATPMVYRPADGPEQLIVLGSTQLDSYYPDTGEIRWWMPVGSGGALGTPVADGNTLLVSTAGDTEPLLPPYDSALEKHDENKDKALSRTEVRENWLAEHFGWLDTNQDGRIEEQEWNEGRRMGLADYGAIALQPGPAEGEMQPTAVLWRVKKSLPYLATPLLYQNVYYMVRDGGIITSLDPSTGEIFKQGRSREALGDYHASPIAADGKLYLANTEGKMTVLRSGPQWEVLRVNDLGEELHATPALSEGSIYVRTRGSLYRFGATE